jgi:hypothetical protein
MCTAKERKFTRILITTINKYSLFFTSLFGNFTALEEETHPKNLSSMSNTYV